MRPSEIDLANTQAATGANAWGQAFGYDPWGNLTSITVTQGSAPALSAPVNADSQATSSGFSYDAAGDLLTDSVNTYTWNAEGKTATVSNSLHGTETYTYDGDGRRVMKKTAAKLYWYGINGDVLSESDLSGNITDDYIFFGGKRIARVDAKGDVDYYLSDALGSSRTVTDSNGNILDDCDFLPFGDERCVASSSGNNYKFTGKERDSESGNDYFGARYYTNILGRFVSPDPLGGHLKDPQTLNKYSYVRDNPLTLTDPTGMYVCADSTKGHDCTSKEDRALARALANDLKSKNADVVRAAKAYGKANVDNGVTVRFGDPGKGSVGTTVSQVGYDPSSPNLVRADSDITLKSGLSGAALDATVAHEGSHAADAQEEVAKIAADGSNLTEALSLTERQSEQRAYGVTDAVLASEGATSSFCPGDCRLGSGVSPAAMDRSIQQILEHSPYNLAPGASGPLIIAPVTTLPH